MKDIVKRLKRDERRHNKTMNDENLIPHRFKKNSDTQREIARKGGIASGEAKRRDRIIKDAILKRMSEDQWNAMIDNAIQRAIENDDCFKTLRDSVGQKPSDKVEATIDSVSIDVTLSDED